MSNRVKRNLVILIPVFSLAIFWFFALTTKSLAIESATSALSNTGGGIGHTVLLVWQSVMGIVDSAIILALIYVAFMNILRIQMDSYTIKKILPTLIMAVILANFSFLIARVLLDVSNIIVYFLINDAGVRGSASNTAGAFGVLTEGVPDPSTLTSGSSVSIYFEYMMKQGTAIIGAVFIWILGFLFLIRNYMIYFMVAIAPAAFMAMVLPVTKKFFTMWWSNYAKWVFAPVVAVFWIWLGAAFYGTVASSTSSGTGWFIQMGFVIACYYMAFTSPFKLGKVMTTWGGLGKKAVKTTGNIAWNKSGAKNYYDTQKDHVTRRLENTKLGQKYVNLRDKGQISRQASQFLLEKQRSDSFRLSALRRLASRRDGADVQGRLKKIVGSGVNDEASNPAYGFSNFNDLQKQLVVSRADPTKPASAYDFKDPEALRRDFMYRDGTDLSDEDVGDKMLDTYEHSAAAYIELKKREKNTAHPDNTAAAGLGLKTVDTRVMASTGGRGGFGGDGGGNVSAQMANTLKQNGITGRNANLAMAAATGAPIQVSAIISGFTPEGRNQFMRSYTMAGKTVAKYEDGLSDRVNGRLSAARNIVGDPNRAIGSAEVQKASQVKEESEVALKLLRSAGTNGASPDIISRATEMAVKINPSIEPSLKLSNNNPDAIRQQLEKVLKDTNSAAQDVINHQGSTVHDITTHLNMNIKSHASAQFHMDGLLNGETSLQDATNRAVLSNKEVQAFVNSHAEQAPQMIEEIEKKVNERLGQTMQKVAGSKSLTPERKATLADAMAAESTKIVSQTLTAK